ncbi:cytoskeleton protein RodZ [Providencia sp. PROV254]|uniref:cytoskeleton protein RodZ n=1 Tax=Providencia sp. PROV254 TaxID=2949942 RepID=UPI002349AFBD|nr:cytoskeleton protein RodZ [Providencia sp. PROV254]
MTIENNTEQATTTVGQLLTQARERMGLTQDVVAERLCLKISTVKEIEQDIAPAGVEPTFLRGYIRLYARMVGIPESELKTYMKTEETVTLAKVSPMQSYSLGKKRKKREGWLMKLTWLIVIVLIAMVGIWWWQDHNAQKNELVSMANQNDLILSQQDNNTTPVELLTSTEVVSTDTAPVVPENTLELQTQEPVLATDPITEPVKTIPLPNAPQSSVELDRTQNTETAEPVAASSQALVLNFTGQCWLEIRDANNKILFSGTKNNGDKLELDGPQPYRLNIGAPANVTVQFKGNTVDLSRFIKAKRPAKLKLPEA